MEAKLDLKEYTSPNKLVEQLSERVRELEEGIERHKSNTYKRLSHPMTDDDLILYRLIETPVPAQAKGPRGPEAGRKEGR